MVPELLISYSVGIHTYYCFFWLSMLTVLCVCVVPYVVMCACVVMCVYVCVCGCYSNKECGCSCVSLILRAHQLPTLWRHGPANICKRRQSWPFTGFSQFPYPSHTRAHTLVPSLCIPPASKCDISTWSKTNYYDSVATPFTIITRTQAKQKQQGWLTGAEKEREGGENGWENKVSALIYVCSTAVLWISDNALKSSTPDNVIPFRSRRFV